MPVWTIVKMFITFIRELLFDSKDELDYKSSKFNPRKVLLFIIILALGLAVFLLSYRLVNQSIYVVKLKEAIIVHELQDAMEEKANKRKAQQLVRLQDYVRHLPEKVKMSNPVPSDSGNEVENTTPPPEKFLAPPVEDEHHPKPVTPERLTRAQRDAILERYPIKK